MSRYEKTNNRPTDYSSWHRTLPNSCPTTDIDFVEIRNNVIKALVEVKNNGVDIQDWQKNVYIELAKKLECAAYFIRYTINEFNYNDNIFNVTNLITNESYTNITEDIFREFMKDFDEKILIKNNLNQDDLSNW